MVELRLRHWFGKPKSRRPAPARAPRVRLEQLEDRLAPALVNWICTTGNWSDTSCWSTGQLPGAGDDVVLGASAVVTNTQLATSIRSLRNLGQLNLTGTAGQSAVLSVAFPSTNEAGATFRLRRAIVDGAGSFTNLGTLEAQGLSRLDAVFSNQAGATLRVLASNLFGPATANSLTFTNSTTNSGRIELTSSNGFFTSVLRISNGLLTNAPGGVITTLVGTGGGRNILGGVVNQGTMSPGTNLAIDNLGNTFDTQAGTITVAAGRTLALKGGRKVVGGRTLFGTGTTLGGTGTIDLAGTHVLDLPSDFTLRPGPRLSFSGTVTVNGPGRFINQATFQSTSDIFNAQLVNESILEFLGVGSEVRGQFTSAAGSTTRVVSTNSHGAASAIFSQGFTNGNLIELMSRGSSADATLTVLAGVLDNPFSTTIRVHGLGTRNLNAAVTNAGTLQLDTSLRVDNTNRIFRDVTGVINFGVGADLTLANGQSQIGDAAIVLIGAPGNTLRLTGTHTMNLVSSAFFLGSQGPRIKFVGQVTVNGPGILVSQIPLELTGDIINADLENQNIVIAWGAGNAINGQYTATPGSGIRIEGRDPCEVEYEAPACGNADLTFGRDFINRGPLTLTSLDNVYDTSLFMPEGTTLRNEDVITAETGSDGMRNLGVQMDNRGQIRIAAPNLLFTGINAAHVNAASGLIDATVGSLVIDSAASLHNLGTFDIGDSQQIILLSGTVLNQVNNVFTGGVYRLNNGIFRYPGADIITNLGDIQLTGPLAQIINHDTDGDGLLNFEINGRVGQTVGRFLINNIPDYQIAGNFTNNGVLTVAALSSFSVVNGKLTNFAGGTLSGQGVYDISGILAFTGANIVINAATLILSANGSILDELGNDGLGSFIENANLGILVLQNGKELSLDAFMNRGLVEIRNAGTLRATGEFTQQIGGGQPTILRVLSGGQFLANPGVRLSNETGARIEGNGTIQCEDVQNAGTLAPGVGNTVGTLTVKGNYAQTAAGTFEVNLLNLSEFDRLIVTYITDPTADGNGRAGFAGNVVVAPINPFNPPAGSTYEVIRYRTRSPGGSTFGSLSPNYTAIYTDGTPPNFGNVTIRRS